MKSQLDSSQSKRMEKLIYVGVNDENNNVKKLIINADDFGLIKERDQGIIELIEKRRVTSVSVLVNGNNLEQASKRLKNMIFKQSGSNQPMQINPIPTLSIGLHFNLTQGPALCQTIPCSLLSPQTKQFLGKPAFYTLLNQLKPLPLPTKQFIKSEFRLQLQKFIQTFSIRPSHIDGHNHVHVVREVAELIAPIMKECGVYKVRVPEELLERPEENGLNEVFVNNAREAREVYDRQGIVSPGHFIGLEEINVLDLSRIQLKINSIAKQQTSKENNNFIQLMCHPGYPSLTSTDPFHSSPERLTQYNSLNSEQFQQKFLTNPTIKLCTFNELSEPVNSFNKRRILLYSKMNSGSGNWTTSLRLQQIFQTLGYQVYLRSIEQSVQPSYQVEDLRRFLIAFKISLVIGVNLTRSGTIVHKATRHPSHITYKVPYLFIVAGTDANIYFNKPQAPSVLAQPIKQCQLLISLSQSMLQLTKQFLTTKLNYTKGEKPLVLLSQSSNISFYQRKDKQEKQNIYQCLKENYRLDVKKDKFIVFPASFRPVKDIEFCLKQFNHLITKYQGLRVLILGPILDQDYYDKCKPQLGRVQFLGSLQKELYVEVLKHAIILVNTSISQGQSCSIQQGLEAGQLCVVRNNPGNAELIKHKETGFLYDTSEQFVQIFDEIMRNQGNFIEKIKHNALEYHRLHFSVQAQAKSYKKIFDSILPQKPILFTYPDVHPVSKVNIGLYNQVPSQILVEWHNQTNQQNKRMIDLGCGSGIFSFTVIGKFPEHLQKQINLELYDFSSSILSNTYYNALQQSCQSLKSLKSLTLQQSDMFSNIPNPSEPCLYLANMPQCPFQCQTSRPDKNGGLDSLKYNEILLRTFATFSEQSLLVMLYSYMAWPKRFFALIEELGLEIVWKGERVSFFVKGEEYEKMEKGLVEFLKGHINEGRAQVEVMTGDNGSEMFIVPAQMLAIKKKRI